ncbi:hypothetical protein ACIOJD_28220 [Streptomyces sp. NPDC088116]|uniref:hypothetical protein n=1 Tax=Streptomyces sp. NPDC088116 TaxID=3365825 RepID=UPI003806B6EA
MTSIHSKYADFEHLQAQAVALRREGLSLRQIRDRLKIHNNDILGRLVQGEPPPEWTKRPNAKDDLREQARELRLKGLTYDQIQVELGCSKSSISLWVRDLPKPDRRDSKEQAKLAARKRWDHELAIRDGARQETKAAAAREIGFMSERELFLLGVGLYWSEGAKAKPHNPQERVSFINSDPHMVGLFLAWLDLLGVARSRLRHQVHIHENANVPSAEQFWAGIVGVDVGALGKTVLKRHNPKTNRKNVGDGYHGCLNVRVLQSADLYRRIEGWWYGIVGAALMPDPQSRT